MVTNLLILVLAAAPRIDLALVERTGPDSGRVMILKADPRLEALCFDPTGIAPEEVEQAQRAAAGSRIWLYLGPRRIGVGHLLSVESAPYPGRPCVVAGEAVFEEPVPFTASADLLWVSTQKHASSARFSKVRDALEKARRALEPALAEACLKLTSSSARGVNDGTFVALTCPADDGLARSVLVFLPTLGGPAVLDARDEDGAFELLDVLNPEAKRPYRLALARRGEYGRFVELWSWDGMELKRLDEAY